MSHLFLSHTGDLYDTRVPNWSARPPLRPRYWFHAPLIESVADFKGALRSGASTDLGGYPLYFVMSDGESMSFESARENVRKIIAAIQSHSRDGWRPIGVEINYEGDLICCHSGKRIPSAYGDD